MKFNSFSLTARTVIASVVLATGASVFAQTDQVSVVEYDLMPTTTFSTKHQGQAQKDRVDASGRKPSGAAHLPKFQNRPRSIMRSVEAPRGNVYAVVNRYEEMEHAADAYMASLNLTTGVMLPEWYNASLNKIGDDYTMRAVACRKGELLVPETGIENMNGFSGIRWTRLDLSTGMVNGIIEFTDNMADCYSMTYDPDKDLFYTVSFDNRNGVNSVFGIVNPNGPNGWTYTPGQKLSDYEGSNQPYIPAITYNPVDKKIYAFDNRYGVYEIEYHMHPSGLIIEDNYLVEVGETSCEELDNPMIFGGDPDYGIYAGAVTYSPMDEMFVAIFRDNMLMGNRILFIHPETFEAFVGKNLTPLTPYVNALFCIDEVADADAPELPATPVAVFDKQSLSGEIKYTTPTKSFVGVDITGEPLECITLIDGKEVDKRTVKAGDSFTLPITLEQGQHALEYYASLNGKTSPARRYGFYVGYDSPVAPTGVDIAANVLTWKANGNEGYHSGYVDMADLGYNIYVEDVKQNTAPVKATTFTLNVPEEMKRYRIAVTAVSQGQESLPTVINPIFGKAFDLPFSQTPTREEVVCFDFYNEDNDNAVFKYGTHSGTVPGLSFTRSYFNDADDWLVLPAVHLTNPDALYEFAFTMRGHRAEFTNESYAVYVAKRPEPKYLKEGMLIYDAPEEKIHGLMPSDKHFTFAVPEAGDYYIGLHVKSKISAGSAGMFVHDFSVRELSGKSAAVPGKLTDVVITPGEYGDQYATATVVLPTKDLLDRDLPKDSNITLMMSYLDTDGTTVTTEANGKPGEKITIENTAPQDGFVVYTLSTKNENGEGYRQSYSVYVGIDTPLCPVNIKGVPTEDNMGLNLTWDAPGKVGKNGGYVDIEAPDFKYVIYTVDGVTKHKMDDTKELAYTFRPFGDATRGKLTTFNVGPAANNVAGESSNSIFVRDDIGSPYELPMKEEFNTANFSYFPYTFFTSQAYSGSTWENQGNLFNQGFTDIVPIEGVLVGSNEGRPTLAKTNLPKFTTEGIKKVVFVLRYLDYAHAPKFIQIYGRSSKDNEESYVGEITLKNPAKADWAESEVILPETLTDCPWVQLRVATNFAGNLDEYLIIDSYTIMPDADFDLKVSDLDGRTEATLGDDVSYNVVVANSGRERMSGKLLVELTTPDGKVLDSQSTDIRNLNSSQTADFTANFHIESSYSAYKTLRVVATVDSEGDENINNNMKVLDLSLMSSSLPIVNDLKANVNEAGNVDLSWSPAETEYGNFENFESYKPFADTESFDYWGNYNGDDLWPSFFQNQTTGTMVRWENDNKKLGWQVYDWYEMYNTDAEGTAYTTPAYIERLKPHSGRQALLARCGGYEEGSDPVATSKWLVSPLVKPGTMLSFYYTTFESSTTEYIEIWTCEKENGKFDPFDKNINLGRAGDFKKKTSKSKSGSEIWELVTYTLGRKDCQFALRYISYDGYAAAIDDLSFTPAQKLTRKAESYNVYRTDKNGENPVCIAHNITGTSFTDTDWHDTDARYYVVSNCTVDGYLRQSPISNVVFIGSSAVGEITAAQKVSAGFGVINVENFAGEPVVIAAADGKVVVSGKVASNNYSYSIDKGIYLVTIGKKTYKVVVK